VGGSWGLVRRPDGVEWQAKCYAGSYVDQR
jgi:hypothetical protein